MQALTGLRGINLPFPVTSQRMRTPTTSETRARCTPLNSAVGIFSHLATVWRGTQTRRASSDALSPTASIAVRKRAPNTAGLSVILRVRVLGVATLAAAYLKLRGVIEFMTAAYFFARSGSLQTVPHFL